MIGPGWMTFPYLYHQCGLITASLILLAVGILIYYTIILYCEIFDDLDKEEINIGDILDMLFGK